MRHAAAARGVIMSIVVSAVFGYILALGVTFAIQDFARTTGAGTFAVKQIFLDSLGDDDGEGDAGRSSSARSSTAACRRSRRPRG